MDDADLSQKEARMLDAAEKESMDEIWQALHLHEAAARDDMTCLTVVREP